MEIITHKRGYYITVVSWENDGDMYATKVAYAETEEETKFLVEFAKLFYKDLGNKFYDEMTLEDRQTILDLCNKYPAAKNLVPFDVVVFPDNLDTIESVDLIYDLAYEIMDILGLNAMEENLYSRVTESIRVHYYPENVYAFDVTGEF